jgi:hypothetical protein
MPAEQASPEIFLMAWQLALDVFKPAEISFATSGLQSSILRRTAPTIFLFPDSTTSVYQEHSVFKQNTSTAKPHSFRLLGDVE